MWSFSNIDTSVCVLHVGGLITSGRFCMYSYPHSHAKPIILSPRFILRHFLALQLMFCLWIFHRIFASLSVIGK